MTLCCVWFSADNWQLASDSRLSVTDELTVDISVKVTSFRVRIPMPSSAGLDGIDMLVDQEVGFMAAGDVATTLPVRESLRAAMARMWINPSLITELSMRRIAEVSAEVLLRLWRRRSEMDVSRVFATVCIVGWCPQQKCGRAFLLEPHVAGGTTKVVLRELQQTDGVVYFGSGAKVARHVAADKSQLTPPQVIRQVVGRQLDPTVGGRVQYGKLVSKDFEVYAVYDFTIDDEQKVLVSGYFIGGVELLAESDQLHLPDGYTLLPGRVVTPFLAEEQEALAQGFMPVTGGARSATLIGKPPSH